MFSLSSIYRYLTITLLIYLLKYIYLQSTYIYLSIYLSIYISIYLSTYKSIFLFIYSNFICRLTSERLRLKWIDIYLFVSIYLSGIYICIYQPTSLSIYVFMNVLKSCKKCSDRKILEELWASQHTENILNYILDR